MRALPPSSPTTLAVLLGSGEWPLSSDHFASSPAFPNAANRLKRYLLDPSGFNLPTENLVDLFNCDLSPDEIDLQISTFIDTRTEELRVDASAPRDILVYYIGHGDFFGSSSEYHLAIKRTRVSNLRASGVSVESLAHTLKEKARFLRRIVILDCCFAGSAFRNFQAAPGTVAVRKTIDAFR